jgi:transcription antitermination factor NusG
MSQPHWYTITTQPRHEKVVAELLQAKSVEVFLPLIAIPSRWKDRTVVIQNPIFPGYVFTRIELHERPHIYSVPGFVRMLSFNGKPAVIEDAEIEAVRLCLTRGHNPQPHPFLEAGQQVRVKSGSLAGMKGVVVRAKNQCRIVVSISMIHQAVSVEIDGDILELLAPVVSMSTVGQ